MSRNGGQSLRDLKQQGRKRADALRVRFDDTDDPLGWFDACYERADGESALVPWAHEVARPEFVEWLETLPSERRCGRAVDVGCGLGDNAVELAKAGFDVTAFDISETAIRWAAQRFPDYRIDWRTFDLTEPPEDLEAAFDLVNETYTLQILQPPYRDLAIRALPHFVKPGGTVLIVGRGRLAHEPVNPPPWPIVPEEFNCLLDAGLELVSFADFYTDRKGMPVRHFRIECRRLA
ncbi:MAG: class I SAM-dependent methyltransferase [Hyphomicrobiaceae bacterium]|nr:class I SAM-dependent methyltransferase [Hyphomicrobiaceae bacterium]